MPRLVWAVVDPVGTVTFNRKPLKSREHYGATLIIVKNGEELIIVKDRFFSTSSKVTVEEALARVNDHVRIIEESRLG